MYLRGPCGMNLQRVDYLFADEGHYAFGAIMSKNRFKFLLSHITFDNHIDCENNWPTDRFATMRPVWELLNSNLGKYVASSEYLTTNETLCPVQHQIAFRQCNPNKPHKYGVLLKLLNDARFPYPYKALPYAAKPTAGDGPFYISSTADYVKNPVIRTKEQVRLDGRNISMDRLYTSVEIASWLLEKNMTIVGTVQKGRVGFPKEVFDTKNREMLSKTCHYEKIKRIYVFLHILCKQNQRVKKTL